jgi:hypothetical protein
MPAWGDARAGGDGGVRVGDGARAGVDWVSPAAHYGQLLELVRRTEAGEEVP